MNPFSSGQSTNDSERFDESGAYVSEHPPELDPFLEGHRTLETGALDPAGCNRSSESPV